MPRAFYPKEKRIPRIPIHLQEDLLFDLINAFSHVKNPVESALLLNDLLTASEIRDLSKRLRIAKRLISGQNQRDIQKELKCGFATITKVSLWLQSGGEGLRRIIARLPERKGKPRYVGGRPGYRLPQLLLAVAQHTLSERETKQLRRFLDKMNEKAVFDRSFQEAVDELYRDKKSSKT